VEAFTGHFNDHHRFLLSRMLARIDGIDADIAVLDAQIEAHLAPFDHAVERLDEIPGIGPVAAAVIIAEIGLDMTRFPTAGHLCSWAKFSPGIKSSAVLPHHHRADGICRGAASRSSSLIRMARLPQRYAGRVPAAIQRRIVLTETDMHSAASSRLR
jgi:transposase